MTENATRPTAGPLRRSLQSTKWPLLLIAAAVLLANLPAILTFPSFNPLDLQTHLDPLSTQGLLPGFPSIDPNNGITAQALGHLAALDWTRGLIPWWNPYEGVGMPLASDMESASFLPLVFLQLTPMGILFFHLALEFASGLTTYALARRIGLATTASVAAAIGFALNGTFSWLDAANVNPIPLLPPLLLGIELARSGSGVTRQWGRVLIAISLALSIYAGFPEVTAIDALFAGFWCLLRARGLTLDAAWQWLQSMLIGTLVGLLLAAPLVVSFLDYVVNGDLGQHAVGFTGTHLAISGISMLSLPYVYGPIFGLYGSDPTGTLGAIWSNIGGYVTPSLVTLALLTVVGSIIRRQDRVLRVGLALWVLLSLCTTFGIPFVGNVLELVPGVSHTLFLRWAPTSWEFATIILAAMAITDIAHGRVRRREVWVTVACAILVWITSAGVAVRLIGGFRSAPHIHLYLVASVGWAMLITVVIAALSLRESAPLRSPRALTQAMLASVVVLDTVAMFLVPQFSAPPKATIDMGPVRFLQAHLGHQRFFTLGPIQPDYGSYFQIGEANDSDLPIPRAWSQYVATDLAPNTNPIVFSGLQVNSESGPSPWRQFVEHFRTYERIGVKYLVVPASQRLGLTPSRLGMVQVYSDRVATIYELPHTAPFLQTQSGGCSVRVATLDTALTYCSAPGTLIRREMYFPGWSATVGGRTVQILRVDSIFQAVRVPSGRSVVTFTYEPPYVPLAALAFVVGLAVWIREFVVAWRRRAT
ncbi:MAG: hypothetical protein ACREN1_00030 [Candidatus Dormibacteria bacterium]